MADSVSVRIDQSDITQLDFIAKYENKSKSEVLREILTYGIKEKKLKLAIKKFNNNEITIGKAAKLADMPLTTFMDILSERKIRFHYGIKELEEDFEGLI